jgi:hypothetical protein
MGAACAISFVQINCQPCKLEREARYFLLPIFLFYNLPLMQKITLFPLNDLVEKMKFNKSRYK